MKETLLTIIKFVARYTWLIIKEISHLISKSIRWWRGKYLASEGKTKAAWGCSGVFLALFICSVCSTLTGTFLQTVGILPTLTPAPRQAITANREGDTEAEIPEIGTNSLSSEFTNNDNDALKATLPSLPIRTLVPTNTPRITQPPQSTSTPEPTKTLESLDVRFAYENTAFGLFDLFVSGEQIRIAFDLEGDNAGVTNCEALGAGFFFRESIPLHFSLRIIKPDGTEVLNISSIAADGSGAGYTCHLRVENKTGMVDVKDFAGMSFTLTMSSNNEELDSIRLFGDNARLVLAVDLPVPTTTPEVINVVTNTSMNVRSGPGTNYSTVQTLPESTSVLGVGLNAAKTWVQIELPSGELGWVSVDFVTIDNPVNLAIISDIPPTPIVASSEQQSSSGESSSSDGASGGNTDNPFQCVGGCATPPDPSCVVKGNVNSSGEKIYHVPGGSFYDRTDIKPEEGDRWFCTEAEAVEAGFRRSER